MIKTVFRVYEVTQTFTRNEVKRMLVKKHASEWGHILFNEVITKQGVISRATPIEQFEPAIASTHHDFEHAIALDKTDTGTVLVNITLRYIQTVEIATDKADWVAYRTVFFDAHLTEHEKDLLQNI